MGFAEVSKTNKSTVMRTLFPFYQEMLFILVLAIMAKFNQVGLEAENNEVEKQKKRFFGQDSNLSQSDRSPVPLDDEDYISSCDESVKDKEKGSNNSSTSQDDAAQADNTLRGYFERGYQELQQLIKYIFQRCLNLVTIHSTKVALVLLFCVSAFWPNFFNFVLFAMFLFLSLSNNT